MEKERKMRKFYLEKIFEGNQYRKREGKWRKGWRKIKGERER
jgi:hypothetical protein